MNDTQLTELGEVGQFLTSADKIEFNTVNPSERYRWIGQTLKRLKYFRLKRHEKGVVREYLMKMTNSTCTHN